MSKVATLTPALADLARLAGVQTSYRGFDGLRHAADQEVIVGVLQAFGVPIGGADEAPEVLAGERVA